MTLATNGHDAQLVRFGGYQLRREADGVGVERARQAAVGREQHHAARARVAAREQRMLIAAQHRGEIGQNLVDLVGVRPRLERRVLGTFQLRRGDKLHRSRDLLDVADRRDAPPDLALTGHWCWLSLPSW